MSGKARLIVGVGMLMVLWLLGPVADVRADQLPDLTVSLDAPRGVALAGETFSVMATIQNIGNAAAPGSTVRYSLEGVVLLNQTLPPLAARGKISAAAGLPIPAGAAPGTYRLVAEVDPSGLIQERRENNNTAATTLTISTPLVEWVLADGTVVSARSGALGLTGVTVEVRGTPTAHGKRYDVRLRNRTGTDYSHTALRVRLPRAGTATAATIEGLTVPVPAEVHQGWEPSALAGTQYGFAYAITSGATVLRRVGPSTVEGQWGGRTAGLVRIDGNAYLVPEFWERQPRRITVTATEVVLTLFEGAEPLRAGEDAWDRFATLDAALADATALAETDALPTLPAVERQALMARFGIAPEGLPGLDPEAEAALRQYDRWQGTSWDKAYATDNPQTAWPGEENSTKTTLFSLLRRGLYYPVTDPKTYAWRDYGDIQWAEGMSAGHYDWVRAALKHDLKTGNLEALHWGMAAVRSAVSVDHA
ncbi:MAG TPA: CARDB domain-containing protein, partial [Methylomirabilota bacterium]|nr:CARDB domain-containing protein [Methylomirabilota bacterium]